MKMVLKKINPYLDQVRAIAAKEGSVVVPVCAAIEADLAEMEEEDRAEFIRNWVSKSQG